MNLDKILAFAAKARASDIHLKAGLPPIFRIDGSLRPLPKEKAPALTPEQTRNMALSMMNNAQKEHFERHHEVDLAYGLAGVGRFRVNAFTQRGFISMIFRTIPVEVMNLEDLHLPDIIKTMAAEQRGLILVTGTTGSGKSTTLASIIKHINCNRAAHIITIEDPIEFLHKDFRSVINQREIGVDTERFDLALKSALRQDPDVVLVGEMRDYDTIQTALTAAETGHLVLSTLHTLDAPETINRIISVFPPYQQRQIRLQLAAVLKGVISQRLVPRADGKGRVPAVEIMVSTARVRELIDDKERTKQLRDAIAQGHVNYGMQTFDQSLMSLLGPELITYEEALRQSSNPDDFKLKVSGISSTSDTSWDAFTSGEGDEDMSSDE